MKAFEVLQTSRHKINPGKQALLTAHRQLVTESARARCKATFNFDAAIGNTHQRPRFDYLLQLYDEAKPLIWLEAHPFKPREIVQKRLGTNEILRDKSPEALGQKHSWHVVPTNPVRSDMATRFTAETGIRLHRNLLLSTI